MKRKQFLVNYLKLKKTLQQSKAVTFCSLLITGSISGTKSRNKVFSFNAQNESGIVVTWDEVVSIEVVVVIVVVVIVVVDVAKETAAVDIIGVVIEIKG